MGITILRNDLIESSKFFPITSIYNKSDRLFWNRLKKETFPKNRVDTFYAEEIYHNKSNYYNLNIDRFITTDICLSIFNLSKFVERKNLKS